MGAQVETIRVETGNPKGGKTDKGKSKDNNINRQEVHKVKQEITKQHRHKTKLNKST